MNLGIIYLTLTLYFLVLGLIIYGVDKTRPRKDRIIFTDEEDIVAVFFFSFLWPLLAGFGIIYCICKLPILLGEYIGNTHNKHKAKKEFKELINNKK